MFMDVWYDFWDSAAWGGGGVVTESVWYHRPFVTQNQR